MLHGGGGGVGNENNELVMPIGAPLLGSTINCPHFLHIDKRICADRGQEEPDWWSILSWKSLLSFRPMKVSRLRGLRQTSNSIRDTCNLAENLRATTENFNQINPPHYFFLKFLVYSKFIVRRVKHPDDVIGLTIEKSDPQRTQVGVTLAAYGSPCTSSNMEKAVP